MWRSEDGAGGGIIGGRGSEAEARRCGLSLGAIDPSFVLATVTLDCDGASESARVLVLGESRFGNPVPLVIQNVEDHDRRWLLRWTDCRTPYFWCSRSGDENSLRRKWKTMVEGSLAVEVLEFRDDCAGRVVSAPLVFPCVSVLVLLCARSTEDLPGPDEEIGRN